MSKWSPSAKFCASSAHVGWAASAMLGTLHHNVAWYWCVTAFVVYAALKEFWADLTWLEHDSWQGSTLDFATYVVGIFVGIVGYYHYWLGLSAGVVVLLILAALDYFGVFARIPD